MLLCVCERGGGVLQFLCPYHFNWNVIVVQYASHFKWNFNREINSHENCTVFFFPSVLLTVCQMGNAILHLNLFIRPIQKWYDCKDFRSISFFFPEVYPIVVSISARIANETKNLVFDVMARNEGRRERHEKSLHIAYCRSFYSQCEWNREFYESKAKH